MGQEVAISITIQQTNETTLMPFDLQKVTFLAQILN